MLKGIIVTVGGCKGVMGMDCKGIMAPGPDCKDIIGTGAD